jgi:hypothetical protein
VTRSTETTAPAPPPAAHAAVHTTADQESDVVDQDKPSEANGQWLTLNQPSGTMPSMSRKKRGFHDQLRAAIKESGMSCYQIVKRTRIGERNRIHKAILSRFMNGKGGLSIESIAAIWDLLHLEISRKKHCKAK